MRFADQTYVQWVRDLGRAESRFSRKEPSAGVSEALKKSEALKHLFERLASRADDKVSASKDFGRQSEMLI